LTQETQQTQGERKKRNLREQEARKTQHENVLVPPRKSTRQESGEYSGKPDEAATSR